MVAILNLIFVCPLNFLSRTRASAVRCRLHPAALVLILDVAGQTWGRLLLVFRTVFSSRSFFFCLPKGLHKSKRYGCFNILLKIYAKRFNEIFGKATLNMSLSRQTKSKI